MIDYFNTFDVLIFFKHWSTGVDSKLQNAILEFTENGGGVLGLHHAVYNDVDDVNPALNKNILTSQLFGVASAEVGWSATRSDYKLYSTNYGHFVSTFNIDLGANASEQAPNSWSIDGPVDKANQSPLYYQTISVFDEVYNNKTFVAESNYGYSVNDIIPLFSNDLPGMQAHTEGFVRLFNLNSDNKVGKVAFFQPGENRLNFDGSSIYGQVVRNAIVWLAK
jgi:hypothetical protein